MTCVRLPGQEGGRRKELRTFGTTTRQLLALRDWLAAFGVTVVAMESTGVYWKPVYYLVEDDFESQLLNGAYAQRAWAQDRRVRRRVGAELVQPVLRAA